MYAIRSYYGNNLLIKEQYMTESTNLDPESFLPLSPPVFHILMALVDEERHGYGNSELEEMGEIQGASKIQILKSIV